MPRPRRVFFDGAIYHVYNRVARGERVLGEEGEAARFVGLLKEVMTRDQVSVLAWCVLSNHYHLALRTSAVTLDRPMRSVNQRFTRQYNARHRVFGPLWQGRYRAKLVKNQRYLDQLLIYIHLNPVTAGMVFDPAEYRWSGHRELVRRYRDPLIDVDEVLRLFGKTKRGARARYVRTLKGTVDKPWIGENPGRLPWWRLGRPSASDLEDPQSSGEAKRQKDADRQSLERPDLSEEEFLRQGASSLGVDFDDLRGRGRTDAIVRSRELLATLGIERFGLQVKTIAAQLHKHPVTASGWVMRGTRRRQRDSEFRARYEWLDQQFAGN